MMSILTIRVEPLKAVSAFQSKEESRYYLRGVFFEKTGLLVATDGHRLAAIKPKFINGEFVEMILPADTIKKILQVKQDNKRLPLYVSFDSETHIATVHHDEKESLPTLAAFPFLPIDATFPDFRRVIPKADRFDSNNRVKEDKKKGINADSTINQAGFNTKYLGEFQAFGPRVMFYQNIDETAPSVFRSEDENFEAIGVLMPMRGYLNEVSIIPQWLEAPVKKEEAKKVEGEELPM